MRFLKKFRKYDPAETDAQREDLAGPVRRVMQVFYKAHLKNGKPERLKIESDYSSSEKNFISFYNEKGQCIKKIEWGSDGKHVKEIENGLPVKQIWYNPSNKLYQSTVFKFANQKLLETICTNAEGSLFYRVINTYRDDWKQLTSLHVMGPEEKILNRCEYSYDEKGNLISMIQYKGDGSIEYKNLYSYNEQGKQTESITEYTASEKKKYGRRLTQKYNEHGDCVEQVLYDGYGNIQNTYNYSHEYDKDGKRIIKPPANLPADQDEESKNETYEFEKDHHGNWIKATVYYKKHPVNIVERQISYFGENDDKISEEKDEHLLDTSQPEEVTDTTYEPEELPEGKAGWLIEANANSAENFPYLRYYTYLYNEVPSQVTYTGPAIEALVLLDTLKEKVKAQIIHSYSTVWAGNREYLSRYTLIFPHHWGYMLHATGIGRHNAEEYDVPSHFDLDYDEMVHLSQFYLLQPADATGRRDEDFEEYLNHLINHCSLDKKPDKPVINMIEVKGNSFAIVEHAVNDDFEIKDLDINYGPGFAKFHNDLMNRFHHGTKGLVLFHGQPGTGKTFYIRHLLRKMAASRKVVLYMPPNMVDHLVEPSFMTFLSGEVQDWSDDGKFCVLLIEDAEPLLAKRQEGVRIQGITNLLNMTDGLLNDMLNLQIICTFNVDLKRLDSALLRPGRLIARKEFKPLPELEANLLAHRLGIKKHIKGSATLGEIYAMQVNSGTLLHDVDEARGLPPEIEDLL